MFIEWKREKKHRFCLINGCGEEKRTENYGSGTKLPLLLSFLHIIKLFFDTESTVFVSK